MSKLVCLKRIIDGGLNRLFGSGAKLPAAGQFFVFFFLEKTKCFKAIGSQFARV